MTELYAEQRNTVRFAAKKRALEYIHVPIQWTPSLFLPEHSVQVVKLTNHLDLMRSSPLQQSNLLTLRLLMSYVYGAPILDVSRSHTTTQHSR